MQEKQNKVITLLLLACAIFCSCAAQTEKINRENMVVVYFSATATTQSVAKKIASAAGAELKEIIPMEIYTSADLNWRDSQSRSSVEMHDEKSRPSIQPVDVKEAKVIYLGYPIWWDLAPRVVNTFLESVDLKGKTIIPFATSGSGPITNSVKVLKAQYPEANWKEGKLLNGASEKTINDFVK